MSDSSITFEYLKSELFRYAEQFQIEAQKDPLDWNEIAFLNSTINTHEQLLIQKLNEESPRENGKIRCDIYTIDELDRLDVLRRFDNDLLDEIEHFVNNNKSMKPIELSDVRYDASSPANVCNSSNFVRLFSYSNSISNSTYIYRNSECTLKALSGYYSQSDYKYRYWNGKFWENELNYCVF